MDEETDEELRAELVAARDRLRRQIEVMEDGPLRGRWAPGAAEAFRAQTAELQGVLAEIEEQLAALGG